MHIGNILAVESYNDVSGLNSRFGRGAVRRNGRNERAARLSKGQTVCNVLRNGLDANAEPAATNVAACF